MDWQYQNVVKNNTFKKIPISWEHLSVAKDNFIGSKWQDQQRFYKDLCYSCSNFWERDWYLGLIILSLPTPNSIFALFNDPRGWSLLTPSTSLSWPLSPGGFDQWEAWSRDHKAEVGKSRGISPSWLHLYLSTMVLARAELVYATAPADGSHSQYCFLQALLEPFPLASFRSKCGNDFSLLLVSGV